MRRFSQSSFIFRGPAAHWFRSIQQPLLAASIPFWHRWLPPRPKPRMSISSNISSGNPILSALSLFPLSARLDYPIYYRSFNWQSPFYSQLFVVLLTLFFQISKSLNVWKFSRVSHDTVWINQSDRIGGGEDVTGRRKQKTSRFGPNCNTYDQIPRLQLRNA